MKSDNLMVKTNSGILVDRKLVKFILNLMEWDNGAIYSVTLSDIDETFWYDDKSDLQEFLNIQTRERFYDGSLRKGYFDYVNENNENIRYNILEIKRGKILSFSSEIIK